MQKLVRNLWVLRGGGFGGRSSSISTGSPAGEQLRRSSVRDRVCVCVEVGRGVAGEGGTA